MLYSGRSVICSIGYFLTQPDSRQSGRYNINPAGTQHQNDVVSTSMRRDHVASTLIRRHFNVVCPRGGGGGAGNLGVIFGTGV